ncbi:MAG: hypothetical protein H7312_10655 [Tardiphaga sp.]|nr:hypothetical protein [Tardiphaga sp.]
MSDHQIALLEELGTVGINVHLQIESYYLIGKIALDNIAHAIEHYFGSTRNMSLDSHDKLCKFFDSYLLAKGLVVRSEMRTQAELLKLRISNLRDYQISHEKSPRATPTFSHGKDPSKGVLMPILMAWPKDNQTNEHDLVTEDLTTLRLELDVYLDMVIAFLTDNQDKTHIKQRVR